MIRLFFTLTFLGLVSIAHAQFDIQGKLEKKIIQDKYVAFLTDKGYSPEVDSDGDIKFLYKERSYYITIDIEDKNFFRLARLANLKLDSESQIAKAKEICHEITKDVKVTKVYWLNGQLWTSSEIVLPAPDNFAIVFDRVLQLTEGAYLKFVKRWQDS